MAKALDPDIETDAAFCLANEKCVEQERRYREFQAFESLDFEEEDKVSFPDLFSALKIALIIYISSLDSCSSLIRSYETSSNFTRNSKCAHRCNSSSPFTPTCCCPSPTHNHPSLPFLISFFIFRFVRDGGLKSYLALPSTTSVSSRLKILSPRIAPPHVALLTAALLQRNSTDLIIDSNNFACLVAEIGQDFCSDLTWEVDALLGLQAAAEDYLVHLFEVRDLFIVVL
jgi:hypothetical protein